MNKIKTFLAETALEMKHVNWPTRQQALHFTLIVIVLSGIVAYLLGLFDYVFSSGLSKLISSY